MAGPQLERILYVEDEASMRTIVQVVLGEIAGYELEVATSGEDALSTLEWFSPQLVLLDGMMPGLDGPETLAEIRKRQELKDVPVVFVTAMDDCAEIERYQAQDVVGVLFKPIAPTSFADEVASIWERIHQ